MLFNNEIVDPFIIICPVCGFTFRDLNPKEKKKNIICPMCNNGINHSKKFKLPEFYKTDKKNVNGYYYLIN
jgi:rubrerythrin